MNTKFEQCLKTDFYSVASFRPFPHCLHGQPDNTKRSG